MAAGWQILGGDGVGDGGGPKPEPSIPEPEPDSIGGGVHGEHMLCPSSQLLIVVVEAAVQDSARVSHPCRIAHLDVSPRFCTHSTHPQPGAVVIDDALAVGEAAAPVSIIWFPDWRGGIRIAVRDSRAACWRRAHHHEEGDERCRH